MEIRLGRLSDIENWMALVREVRDAFPGLETEEALEEHRTTVLAFMQKEGAVCAADHGEIKGILLFSREDHTLCFLAVSPQSRRQHMAEGMVSAMLELLPDKAPISVSTYREGVPEGAAARAFYKRMGFQEGELAEEFGSPVQIFTLYR